MTYFLRTRRLGFRRWADDDFGLAAALWGDPQVMRLIDARGAFTPEQVREKLDREIANERFHRVQYWPVFLLEDDAHVGCCGLRPRDPKKGVYELGFHIRSPLWGRGYASEAAQAVVAYAFDHLGVRALFAGHHPENAASRRLLEKLGFECTGEELYPPTGLRHPSYMLRER
jgi:ribosomal-protein-alanine N-acetyltransferase